MASKTWLVEPVRDPYYDQSELPGEVRPIVRADTRAQAISDSGFLGLYRWTELRAVRAKEFDGQPLTPQTFLEHGWCFECSGCYARLTIDGREGAADPKPPLVVGQDVFCDEACRDKARQRHAEIEAENARRKRDLAELVAARSGEGAVKHGYRPADSGTVP